MAGSSSSEKSDDGNSRNQVINWINTSILLCGVLIGTGWYFVDDAIKALSSRVKIVEEAMMQPYLKTTYTSSGQTIEVVTPRKDDDTPASYAARHKADVLAMQAPDMFPKDPA